MDAGRLMERKPAAILRAHEQRRRTTREANAEARRLLVRALELDPTYASAYAGLSWTYLQSWQFVWTTDRDSLERARELAERAIALNDTLVEVYRVLGQIYLWQKLHDRAIAQAERAVVLAPNDADGYETLAEILAWSGRAEESIKLIRQAMRLNPHYPIFYVWTLAHAYYLTERRQQALEALTTIAKENPNFLPAHAYRAVLLSELGRAKDARDAWAKASQISPDASMANVRERLPYKRASDLDRFLTGMHRVAGP